MLRQARTPDCTACGTQSAPNTQPCRGHGARKEHRGPRNRTWAHSGPTATDGRSRIDRTQSEARKMTWKDCAPPRQTGLRAKQREARRPEAGDALGRTCVGVGASGFLTPADAGFPRVGPSRGCLAPRWSVCTGADRPPPPAEPGTVRKRGCVDPHPLTCPEQPLARRRRLPAGMRHTYVPVPEASQMHLAVRLVQADVASRVTDGPVNRRDTGTRGSQKKLSRCRKPAHGQEQRQPDLAQFTRRLCVSKHVFRIYL